MHTSKTIYITFDDGPHPRNTPLVLDVLKARNIKATFFVLGRNVDRYGKHLVERIVDEGHCLANHSYSHRDLTTLSPDEIRTDLLNCEVLIKEWLPTTKLFRPPYGSTNDAVTTVARDLGYRSVLWNVDSSDWNRNYQSDRWVDHSVKQILTRRRSVVLAHDIHQTTAEHLDHFIQQIEAAAQVEFKVCTAL